MQINKKRLSDISEKRGEATRRRFEEKRGEIYWKSISAALSSKIISRMETLGMTRKDLADRLGVTPACITRYLNEATNLELRTLVQLQRTLGCRIIDTEEAENRKAKVIVLEFCSPAIVCQTEIIGKKKKLNYEKYA